MTDFRETALSDHARLKEIRAVEEPHWREIAAFLRPDDRDFDGHSQRRRDDSPIFTIEPILAVDDFEGGFFSNATNPMNRWMEFSTGDEELDRYQPVKAWLWRRTNQALGSFTPAVSPFYAEMPDFYGHICCFGLSGFYSAEDLGKGRFIDRAIPANETFIGTDAAGMINQYNREFSLLGSQARGKWKGDTALSSRRDSDRFVFVHAVFENPGYRPGALGPDGMPWMSCYVSPDIKEFYVQEGYYEFPYACPRWKRRSGRPYPTGIGHTIRADVVMVNEMERSNIVAAQFLAEPTFLATEKSKILTSDIEPNAVLYGSMNADGKKTFDTIERHQNLPVSLEYLKAKIDTIRRACRWGLTQLMAQRPQMTATEFLGLQKADLELMGPGLVRVQNEGLTVIVARRFNMLHRAGLFDDDPPPPELMGKGLAVKYVSPLSKILKSSDAQGALQWINAMLPIAQAGRPDILDNADMDNLAIVIHDGFSSDPTIIMDPRKRDAQRAQRAAQQQAMAKLQMASQAADIHATVAHANQAQTLATGRNLQ